MSGSTGAQASGVATFFGNTMFLTETTGTWAVGQNVFGVGVSSNCTITALVTGTGGNGSYTVSPAQTVSGSVAVMAIQAGQTIAGLPAATSVQPTDITVIVQGDGVTRKATVSQAGASTIIPGAALAFTGSTLNVVLGTTAGTAADGGALAATTITANAAIPQSAAGVTIAQLTGGVLNINQIPPAVLGSTHYVGVWNASTNSPTITSGTSPGGSNPVGGYYVVNVAGSTAVDGNSTWGIGDWIIWNGTVWNKLDGQANPVSSVAGLQGTITAAQIAAALGLGQAALLNVGTTTGTVPDAGAVYAAVSGATTTATSAAVAAVTPIAAAAVSSAASSAAIAQSAASYVVNKSPVNHMSLVPLAGNTYANGTAGVGATLTATANGVLTVDGVAVALNDRVAVFGEATQANNGIYLCTTAGASGAAYVLTRSTDANTPTLLGSACAQVLSGTQYTGWAFLVAQAAGAITIGTTAITVTAQPASVASEAATRAAAVAALQANTQTITARGASNLSYAIVDKNGYVGEYVTKVGIRWQLRSSGPGSTPGYSLRAATNLHFATVDKNGYVGFAVTKTGLTYTLPAAAAPPNGYSFRKASLLTSTTVDKNGYVGFATKNDGTTVSASRSLEIPNFTGPVGDIMGIITNGQSLAVGTEGCPPLITTQPYNNLMFNTGIVQTLNIPNAPYAKTSFVPAIEQTTTSGASHNYGETGMCAGFNTFSALLPPGNTYPFFLCSGAQGGESLSALSKPGAYYSNFISCFQAAMTIASSLGLFINFPYVPWIQGEADDAAMTAPATYSSGLQTLINNINTDVKAMQVTTYGYSQANDIALIVSQPSSWQLAGPSTTPYAAIGQMLAAAALPGRIKVCGPKYHIGQYFVGDVHMANYGYQRMFIDVVKVAISEIIYGKTWLPLTCTTASHYTPAGASFSVVRAAFNNPSGTPLVLDTVNVTDPNGQKGFEIVDSIGACAITNVQILGPELLQLKTARALATDGSVRLRAAYTAVLGNNAGPTSGPRCCLRDSYKLPTPYSAGVSVLAGGNTVLPFLNPVGPYQTFNWCTTFDIGVS